MKNKKGIGMIQWVIIILSGLFIISLFASWNGWGYPGYNGYYHGGSWFYWGGPQTYYGPSVREGSMGGSKFSGGGLHGGK